MAWGKYGYSSKKRGRIVRRGKYWNRNKKFNAKWQKQDSRQLSGKHGYIHKNLQYVEWNLSYVKQITSDNTPLFTTYYRVNDLYDHTNSGGANVQPLGYDSLMLALNYRYIVYSGSMTLQFHRQQSTTDATGSMDLMAVVYLSRSTTAVTSLRQAMEQPGAKHVIVKAVVAVVAGAAAIHKPGNNPTIRINWDKSQFCHKTDDDFVVYNASPTVPIYLNVVLGSIDGSNLGADLYDTNIITESTFWSHIGRREAPLAVS